MDPYKMVYLNIALSLVLLGGILVYCYIFPKKKVHFFLTLLLLSLLLCVSIFRKGVYESGDFTIHIYRSMAFYESLKEGHILPSWAGSLNATYGYPLFIFNYPLPYYIICFFHFLGFSFITSMKLFLASNVIFSGIFMYLFSKSLFKNSLAAFTASVFYLFTPYHLIDVHFKIVIGEILFFTLLPLFFLYVQKAITQQKVKDITLAGILFALLIMSHVVIALFTAGLLLSYILFLIYKGGKKQLVITSLLILSSGALLSSYIWATPFFLTKYTLFQKMQSDAVYSLPLLHLLFSPWRMGLLFQGPQGEIANIIGYTQIGIITLTIYLLVKNKLVTHYKHHIVFWLGSLVVFIYLITPFSDFIWKAVPFIKNTGNHRLLILVVFCISLLSGYISLHYKKKTVFLYCLIVITIGSTILNWGHRRVIPTVTDAQLSRNLWKSTSENEGHFYANSALRDPKDPWFSDRPKQPIEVKKGQGEIKETQRKTTEHTYVLYAKTPLTLQENTLYFPGWTVNTHNYPISIKPNKNGVITFDLPQGLHYVSVTYEDIPIYKLLKQISVTGFLVAGVLLLFTTVSSRFSRNNK